MQQLGTPVLIPESYVADLGVRLGFYRRIAALADRRGECVHSACQHFRKCFVEKNVRAARHARDRRAELRETADGR